MFSRRGKTKYKYYYKYLIIINIINIFCFNSSLEKISGFLPDEFLLLLCSDVEFHSFGPDFPPQATLSFFCMESASSQDRKDGFSDFLIFFFSKATGPPNCIKSILLSLGATLRPPPPPCLVKFSSEIFLKSDFSSHVAQNNLVAISTAHFPMAWKARNKWPSRWREDGGGHWGPKLGFSHVCLGSKRAFLLSFFLAFLLDPGAYSRFVIH